MIELENVSVRYGDKVAVCGVTLQIPRGEVTAIVGPSGCGKSSVLAALNRLTDLVPGARVEGALRVGGIDVLDPAVDVVALRRRMGLVLQTPTPFPLSIRRNLELPLREHGVRENGRVEEALREVGLWDEVHDRLDSPATELSGGQQQRLCLARALALRPEVLLLDEPCSALDPIATAVVEERIRALRERYTQVLVTHNLAQARRLADRVAVFWLVDGVGQLVESGPTERVFTAPEHPLTARYVAGEQG